MGERSRVVHTQVLAASAVRFVAERCDADEPGVLAADGRSDDVVVSVTPFERRS
jgi:hypothetical protein